MEWQRIWLWALTNSRWRRKANIRPADGRPALPASGFGSALRRVVSQAAPLPGHPAQESLDSQQRLATLEQDGWQILYTDYMSVGGEWLPSKLTLQRQGVRLRLVVDGWS